MKHRTASGSETTERIGQLSRRSLLQVLGSATLAAVGMAGLGATTGCDSAPGPAQDPGRASARPSDQVSAQPSHQVSAPPPRQVIGVNFNDMTDWANFAELRAVSATWLRGFFDMPGADNGSVASQPVLRTLLEASARGYGTVLSLKFPYSRQPMPAPGSPAMATALRRLDAVLPTVMGIVDILIIGNEPFIECRAQDRDSRALNVFYETLARHVIAYRQLHGGVSSRTRLYMGALNHLDLPSWRTAATERWMAYVRDTPDLDGTDIHPHLPAPGAGAAYLDYILPRMRADQTFTATEFSLVLLWRQHMHDPVPADFASRYGLPPGTVAWQVIEDSIRRPFQQRKWDDFLSMTPWFADNSGFLRDQAAKFRATGRLAVAGYGITQGRSMVANFGPQSTPWLLNSLFCPYTVESAPDGLPGQTHPWVEEFRALQ